MVFGTGVIKNSNTVVLYYIKPLKKAQKIIKYHLDKLRQFGIGVIVDRHRT